MLVTKSVPLASADPVVYKDDVFTVRKFGEKLVIQNLRAIIAISTEDVRIKEYGVEEEYKIEFEG